MRLLAKDPVKPWMLLTGHSLIAMAGGLYESHEPYQSEVPVASSWPTMPAIAIIASLPS